MCALYRSRLTRPLLWYLCVALGVLAGVPGEALASPVPLEDAMGTHDQAARLANLARIQTALELKVVRQRLLELGLTEQEVSARLAQLTDEEVHEVAAQVDQLGVGGQSLACQGSCALFWAAVYLGPYVVAAIAIAIVGLVFWLKHRLRPAASGSGRSPSP